MSIYDVMILDALSGVASFGLAILLGVISLGKGLGGVVLCGVIAAGLLTYRHLTAGTSEADRQADPSELSPRELIANLQAALESNPGDVCLSGMVVAFGLAYELEETPPESGEDMLRCLNYGRLIVENGPDVSIEPEDVVNARRYLLALNWGNTESRSVQPRRLSAFMTTGRVAGRPERRDGVVSFPLDVTALQKVDDVPVDVTTRYDVKVSSGVVEATVEQLDVGDEVAVRGSVEMGTQRLMVGGKPVFCDEEHENPVVTRPLQLFASEVTVRQ